MKKKIVIFAGPAATGKTIQSREFAEENGGALPLTPMDLKVPFWGDRLMSGGKCVLMDDVIDFRKLPWSVLKIITGNDPMTLQRRGRENELITPDFMVVVTTNQTVESVIEFLADRPDLERRVEVRECVKDSPAVLST